jgi:hypothetical protein
MPIVRMAAQWVGWISMFFAFFPGFETSRRVKPDRAARAHRGLEGSEQPNCPVGLAFEAIGVGERGKPYHWFRLTKCPPHSGHCHNGRLGAGITTPPNMQTVGLMAREISGTPRAASKSKACAAKPAEDFRSIEQLGHSLRFAFVLMAITRNHQQPKSRP